MRQAQRTPDTGKSRLIALAKVSRAHGIKGEVKVIPLASDPGRLRSLEKVVLDFPDGRTETRAIQQIRGAGDDILRIEGVATRTDAELLKGVYLSIPEDELPALAPGTYYVFDLIGMDAVGEGGAAIGTVRDIEEYPASDVLVIEGERGKIMVPAVREYVLAVDLEERRITVRLPELLPPDQSG